MTMPLPRPVKPTSIYTGIDALAGIIYSINNLIPFKAELILLKHKHLNKFVALTEDGCCFVAGKNTENRLLLENKTESSNLVELKLNFRVKNLAIGPCNSGFYIHSVNFTSFRIINHMAYYHFRIHNINRKALCDRNKQVWCTW